MGAADILKEGDLWRRNCAAVINQLETDVATDIAAVISDTAYASSWNGVTTIAPSKNAVYDKIEALNLASGVWNPTLTDSANVGSSATGEFQYLRVGNTVTASGRISVDATTAATLTALLLTLPVASNFGSEEDLVGVASTDEVLGAPAGIIKASTGTDSAQLEYYPLTNAAHKVYCQFSYQIL